MMRKTGRLLAAAISLACMTVAAPAQAAVSCAMNITALYVGSDGWAIALFDNPTWGSTQKQYALCSFAGSVSVNDGYGAKTIGSTACQAVYSQLLSAKLAGRQAYLYFNGPADCSAAALPASGLPTPYPFYIGMY